MPAGHVGPFRVSRLRSVDLQIKKLSDVAKKNGKLSGLLDDLERVLQNLETRPTDWGDPKYSTQLAGGVVYDGLMHSLVAHYVVFDDKQVVVLLRLTPMPGSFLE